MSNNVKIAPSILSANFSIPGEEIKKLDRSGILKEKLSGESTELRLFIDNDARLYKPRLSSSHSIIALTALHKSFIPNIGLIVSLI